MTGVSAPPSLRVPPSPRPPVPPSAYRLGILVVCLLALSLLTGFSPPAFGEGDPFEQRLGSAELAALRAEPALPVRAVAAAVVDAFSGHTLAAKLADARVAPASLTKMMTALVALERASASDIIRATERSLSEPSIIGLEPGDTLPLSDMLYGLMLPSGNDAALAIAETVGGGSIERFVDWMNERAARMGLANTRFANPHGLDQAEHYSSARDLGDIARAYMADPLLARISSTPRYTAPGPPPYLFLTTNPLLGSYAGLDGVKTGFTDDAGRCFAATAVRDGQRLVVVVLNSNNYAAEAQALLDAGFATSRRTGLEVVRPGFAAVRPTSSAEGARSSVALAGWEAPFLRAFGGRVETSITIGGRTVARWAG